MDQAVQQRLEKSRRQAPLLADSTSDDPSSSEEGPITRRKRTLKSGMEHMGVTFIKKRIPLPHEGVYTADGKPAAYGGLTLMAFVRMYLMVVSMEPGTISFKG